MSDNFNDRAEMTYTPKDHGLGIANHFVNVKQELDARIAELERRNALLTAVVVARDEWITSAGPLTSLHAAREALTDAGFPELLALCRRGRAGSMRRRQRTHETPRTYVEKFDHWRCPRCNVWYDSTFSRCEDCDHARVHVTTVAYECQTCLCVWTSDQMHLHDCEMCSL